MAVPSGNVADILPHLRSHVVALLATLDIHLNDPEELVYQPVLPDSDADGVEALAVILKRPLTGRIVVVWDRLEAPTNVVFMAERLEVRLTPDSPEIPFSTVPQVGSPVEQPEPQLPSPGFGINMSPPWLGIDPATGASRTATGQFPLAPAEPATSLMTNSENVSRPSTGCSAQPQLPPQDVMTALPHLSKQQTDVLPEGYENRERRVIDL